MFDFTATGMRCRGIAFAAVFFMLQFLRRLFIDARFVVLHSAVLANQINVRVLSAWHVLEIKS